MKKKVAILGATGSIGKSALDVLTRDPERFEVVLLTAHSKKEELEKININTKKILTQHFCTQRVQRWHSGTEELLEIKPDITINGISGAAGLEYSVAAIEAGSTLALANKETIVMAGDLILNLAKEKNVKIIPVDSEHSAIFHLLEAFGQQPLSPVPCPLSPIQEIILTASGGPFRNYTYDQLEKVTVKDALAHPTWNMGQKITIDSASMANKGLEVIEAVSLFNLPPEKIKVTIHPQSIIHSMIKLSNGVVYAQASKPDMRYPISLALYYPEISPLNTDIEELKFENLNLEFCSPDFKKFPMLTLSYEAVKQGNLYPCAYNAANEEAVSAFVKGQCSFTDIPKITEFVLQKDWKTKANDITTILDADKNARKEAVYFINKMIK